MQGFDPKFQDFPDYIIGITKSGKIVVSERCISITRLILSCAPLPLLWLEIRV